jgi:two-component system phosphate regulon response regulator PhoB
MTASTVREQSLRIAFLLLESAFGVTIVSRNRQYPLWRRPAIPEARSRATVWRLYSRAMTHHVLVVDDEPDITALVAYHLAKAGYRVTTASSGTEALRVAEEQAPDLVVLDLMLPGFSGYEVLEALRRRPSTQDVGVIMLTARREEGDRIKGLSLGADDYLIKPFAPQELVLRVGAVLRRLGGTAVASGSKLVAGPVVIDRAAHTVAIEGEEIELTRTEYKLLLTLAERRGRVQTRAQLLETVWEAHPDIQTRTVDMHMQRLRTKLGEAADCIETVRGFGYRFRQPESGKGHR